MVCRIFFGKAAAGSRFISLFFINVEQGQQQDNSFLVKVLFPDTAPVVSAFCLNANQFSS
jgi:hypothetical protein